MSARIFLADIAEFQNVTDYVEEELNSLGCPLKICMQFALCLEEIFVNIAHYAYKGDKGNVKVSVEQDDLFFSVTLEDEGIPFNPLEHEDPDITLSAKDREIGGLGIFMVKKTMDEVSYKYDNKNIFCMKKKIQ